MFKVSSLSPRWYMITIEMYMVFHYCIAYRVPFEGFVDYISPYRNDCTVFI